MKRMICTTVLMATGSMALAQLPADGGGIVKPAGGVVSAPVVASVPTDIVNTNKPDIAKIQALYAELTTINKNLRAEEARLQKEDPALTNIMAKKTAALQTITDLDKQRRTLLDAKISADPKIAAMAARKREVMQLLEEMRPEALPLPAGRGENPPGLGPRPWMPPNPNVHPVKDGAAPKIGVPPVSETPAPPPGPLPAVKPSVP